MSCLACVLFVTEIYAEIGSCLLGVDLQCPTILHQLISLIWRDSLNCIGSKLLLKNERANEMMIKQIQNFGSSSLHGSYRLDLNVRHMWLS